MRHPFESLKPEYTKLLTRMKIIRSSEVEQSAHRLLRYIDQGRYTGACNATGVPIICAAASFEREASSRFSLSPAQGDRWDRRSVHVPAGRGPFRDWMHAAVDAYHIDGLDKVGAANWTWELACYYWELFNGFGPRDHGCHTGYLWAGSNNYLGGKYIADHVWSARAFDQQLGVIVMMRGLIELRPELDLPHPLPTIDVLPNGVVPVPRSVPEGYHDAATLQTALNAIGIKPGLRVDGNFGRETKHAVIAFQKTNNLEPDGIAGPKTWEAIENSLRDIGAA
jgi:lysozyme family protein